MGSLPNLHELGNLESRLSTGLKKAQAASPVRLPTTEIEDDNKEVSSRRQVRKVLRARSTGIPTVAYAVDQCVIRQASSYSPVCSARHLVTHHPLLQHQHQGGGGHHGGRRRDSANSSIGATSVRRLIAVVRNTSGRHGPVYSERVLMKNYTVLWSGHSLFSASMFPLLALQGSVSAWYWPPRGSWHHTQPTEADSADSSQDQYDPLTGHAHGTSVPHSGVLERYAGGQDGGALLLAMMHTIAFFVSFVAPYIHTKFGSHVLIVLGYAIGVVFFCAHLYPTLYSLLPAYAIFGVTWPVLWICKVTFLMTIADKLSCVYTDCDDAEHKSHCRREMVVRRLARGMQGAQDLGLVAGSLLVALIITYAGGAQDGIHSHRVSHGYSILGVPGNLSELSLYLSLDDAYALDESGERVCGALACPVRYTAHYNGTAVADSGLLEDETSWVVNGSGDAVPRSTAGLLAGLFGGLAVIALVITCVFIDHIRVPPEPLDRAGPLREFRDSLADIRLRLAAPLAMFIGLEQAFMYADFTKSYVSCAMGPRGICMVFLALGLLQSVAASTLSMFLRHVKRAVVIIAGFLFHACLLLALSTWKPSAEDSALFFVIAACWGVCNAVWETLNFALLSQTLMTTSCWAHSIAFRNFGLAVGFTLHGILCEKYKLLGLAIGLIIAVPPYAYLELKCERDRGERQSMNL